MKFNKIKELAATPDDIEKSLFNSEFLELSCDKQRIRRTTEIRPKDNIDDLTVYVVCYGLTYFVPFIAYTDQGHP